jgi:hypothetical protein
MAFIDGEAVDTANQFMVCKQAGKILIMNPPRGPISKHDAMVFAAWIVALGDDDGLSFEAAKDAVESV